MPRLVLLLDNIRSAHNVGSILRTAEGLGVKAVYALGITPYPTQSGDQRLPHVAAKATNQIAKTALGAETHITCTYAADPVQLISQLKKQGYKIIALEQAPASVALSKLDQLGDKLALVLGNEVDGVSQALVDLSHLTAEIPMPGKKESLNVAAAAAIAIYQLLSKA